MNYVRACIYELKLARDARRGDGWMAMCNPANPGDAAVTLTPGQILGGLIAGATLSAGRAYTLPLATDFAAAVGSNMDIGDPFMLLVSALGNTITVTTNTGWTVTGTATVATATQRFFLITRTAAATFSIQGL